VATRCITKAAYGKWDDWRKKCFAVRADWVPVLELPIEPPIQNNEVWEKAPELDAIFDPVLAKIDGLAGDGLSTLMVVLDYLKRRIAP
jgi:hypothetical protein